MNSTSQPKKNIISVPGKLDGTETILVVDDEPLILAVTSRLLEKFGYAVLTASHGQEALETAEAYEGAIHGAILDIMMPVMNGPEAFPKLIKLRPDLKVLLCSGYDHYQSIQSLLENGARGFLQKPFTSLELASELRRILDGQ